MHQEAAVRAVWPEALVAAEEVGRELFPYTIRHDMRRVDAVRLVKFTRKRAAQKSLLGAVMGTAAYALIVSSRMALCMADFLFPPLSLPFSSRPLNLFPSPRRFLR